MNPENDLYKSILDNLQDGVYFVDRNRRITYWNKGAEMITGYKDSEVTGKHCSDNILIHVDDHGTNLCEAACSMEEVMEKGTSCRREVYLHHKDGHRVPVAIRVYPVRDSKEEIIGAIQVFSDNSPRVALNQKIEELRKTALIDKLTEVGNRRYGEMVLHARFEEMRRYSTPFGILFIDIDKFKEVNDTHGHDTGDKVLKMVSKTLSNNIRSFDIVSRWGGEEFLVIIVNIDKEGLYQIAEKLRVLVAQSSLFLEEKVIQVTVSMGAVIANRTDTPDALIRKADELMYRSKKSGRNRVTI